MPAGGLSDELPAEEPNGDIEHQDSLRPIAATRFSWMLRWMGSVRKRSPDDGKRASASLTVFSARSTVTPDSSFVRSVVSADLPAVRLFAHEIALATQMSASAVKCGQPESPERGKEVTRHLVLAVAAEPDLPEDSERDDRPLLRVPHGDRAARKLVHRRRYHTEPLVDELLAPVTEVHLVGGRQTHRIETPAGAVHPEGVDRDDLRPVGAVRKLQVRQLADVRNVHAMEREGELAGSNKPADPGDDQSSAL